jgi:DNA repair exonuclease SbcCD ATPase subunit
MRRWAIVGFLALGATTGVRAQDLAATCQASSSYDVTLQSQGLLFDRPQPAPFRVVLRDGSLQTDGQTVTLRPDEEDRLSLFERQLRALEPRAKAVARNGVDMLARAVRDETTQLALSAETQAELERRLSARAQELKQRITSSQSTHDWQGDMADRYANQIASDIMPLVANDLGQQAVNAAMSGDLQAAASLRDRATDLATQLRPRLEQRMQALRPQLQALCPDIQRLAELQQGIRASNGQPLNLIHLNP